MSKAITLQSSRVEELPANLRTATVKLLHDFPVSKVSQAVTNQRN